MKVLFVFLLVCGDPVAIVDLQNRAYIEPTVFTNDELNQILSRLGEHDLPYLVRDIGRDCE